MKKQGLAPFLLRALAQQLQSWADFMSSQADEDEPAASQELVPVSAQHALPAEDGAQDGEPPESEYWTTWTDPVEPPEHWRALVQQHAPELLERRDTIKPKSHIAGKDALTPFPLLPIQQPEDGEQTAVSASHPAEDELVRFQYSINEASEQVSERRGDSGQAPVARMHRNASVVDHTGKRDVQAQEPRQAEVDASQYTQPTTLRRDQSVLDVGAQVEPGARRRIQEQARLDEHRESGADLQEGHHVQRVDSMLPAPPPVVMPGPRTSMAREPEIEPVVSSRPTSNPISVLKEPHELWRPEPRADGVLRGEEAGRSPGGPVEQDPWPSLPAAIVSSGQYAASSDESRGQARGETHWPALPEERAVDRRHGEMSWRTWERRQRLDEEQRGQPWNA